MRIELTHSAQQDLNEIWSYNVMQYGHVHANDYVDFLWQKMREILDNHHDGIAVPEFPLLKAYRLKMRASARGGHTAYYAVREDVIWIERVLHTAMNAPDYLG